MTGHSAPGVQRSRDRAAVIALIGGLALLISFFLPWFSVHITCNGGGCVDLNDSPIPPLLVDSSASAFTLGGSGYSAYYAVAGYFSPIELLNPQYLWLVMLASIALIVMALCMLQGTLSARQGRWLIALTAGLVLVVEVIYLFSTFGAFPEARQHASGSVPDIHGPPTLPLLRWMLDIATGPAYGFWIGLVATVAAGAGALLIRQPTLPVGAAAPAVPLAPSPGVAPVQPQQPAQGTTVSARGMRGLTLPDRAALLIGLATLVGFFLPWLITPDFSNPGKLANILLQMAAFGRAGTPPTSPNSGWQIVNGVLLFDPAGGPGDFIDSYPLHLFPQFWLVLLGGVALLVIAWLSIRRRISMRAAGGFLTGISLVVLLLELGLPLQVQALQTDFAMREWSGFISSGNLPNSTPPVLFGITWGFWLAVAVSAAGVALGAFNLLRRQQPTLPPATAGIHA